MPNGVMAELGKLYYDVIGANTPGTYAAVREVAPVSRLLFGSDYPFWSPDVTIGGLASLQLGAADLASIERDNALALLPKLAR